MNIRITDLEKFVNEHIKLPYLSFNEDICNVNLNNVMDFKLKYPEWWSMVIDRINKIGFHFPYYINHEIVDLILLEKKMTAK